MLSGVPVAALVRVFEDTVVKGIFKDEVDVAERQVLATPSLEVLLKLEPVIELPA